MTRRVEDAFVEEELSAARLPKRALTTSLKQEGQDELRAWVRGRGYQSDDGAKGVLLVRGGASVTTHRLCWLRLATELVLQQQNVRCIDALDLIKPMEDLYLEHIDHLFVDGFHTMDDDACPLSREQRYVLRMRVQKWAESGKAVYPYTDAEESNALVSWYGGVFVESLLSHVFEFTTKVAR